jgi:DNA-nicking Smr family endonuclease
MNRRRQLSDEEEALWIGIARSIKPLRPSKTKVKTVAKPVPDAEETKSAPHRSPRFHQAPAAAPKKPPPLAPLDKRQKQRVARGRDAIDAKIDLHGMTQSEAHDALLHFVRRAQTNGAGLILVVTGKGSGRAVRDTAREPGVLRRQVPLWLALPEFRSFIVGFDEAHVTHGGQGALYVRLRRIR